MADILRLCGVAVLGLAASLLLREKHPTFALFCGVAAVLLTGIHFLGGSAATVVQTIVDAVENTAFSAYAGILLRALGIGYICAFTAELCKSAGEAMLAAAVVLAGKVELLLLCLPMISGILEIAAELL